MSRGGKRIGSGLKSTWNHTETTVIRVPKTFVYQVMDYARALDAGKAMDSVTESTKPVTKSSALDLVNQTRTCLAQLEALLERHQSVDSVTQPTNAPVRCLREVLSQAPLKAPLSPSAITLEPAYEPPSLALSTIEQSTEHNLAVAVLEKPITTTLSAQTFSSRIGETALLFINAIAHRDTQSLKDYLSAIAHLATDEEAKTLFKLCKSHLGKLDADGWEWFQSLRNSWRWEEEDPEAA